MKAWKKGAVIGGVLWLIIVIQFFSILILPYSEYRYFTFILSLNLFILSLILIILSKTKPTTTALKGFRVGLIISALVYLLFIVFLVWNESMGKDWENVIHGGLAIILVLFFYLSYSLVILTGLLTIIGAVWGYTIEKYKQRRQSK